MKVRSIGCQQKCTTVGVQSIGTIMLLTPVVLRMTLRQSQRQSRLVWTTWWTSQCLHTNEFLVS